MGRDIPCRAIARFLSNISVCEPVGEWLDGRIRLAGEILAQRFGRDTQGMLISELYQTDRDGGVLLLESARRAQASRQPGLLSARVCRDQFELMRFEVVALPIFGSDGIAELSMVGTFRFL